MRQSEGGVYLVISELSNGGLLLGADEIGSLVSERDFRELSVVYEALFGLEYVVTTDLAKHIKCRIVGKHFRFAPDLSPASRAFMLTHTIGHFFFICEAERRGMDHYRYIYDSFSGTTLNVYDRLAAPQREIELAPKIEHDRVAFETEANLYANDLLDAVGWPHLKSIIEAYEGADIHYVFDIMRRGEPALMPTDRQYIDRYVCGDLAPLSRGEAPPVYRAGRFSLDALNWDTLKDLKFESYFF